jgi:hypothetical protein
MTKPDEIHTDASGEEWHVISTYTREQAIADGVLVDLTARSKELATLFGIPVTATIGLHHEISSDGANGADTVKWLLRAATGAAMQAQAAKQDLSLVEFEFAYPGAQQIEVLPLWLCFNQSEGFTVMRPEDY